MTRQMTILFAVVAASAVWLGGCGKKATEIDFERPLGPDDVALRRVADVGLYPDFALGFPQNREPLLRAIDNSLNFLVGHPSSQQWYPMPAMENGRRIGISHGRVVDTLRRFRTLVEQASTADELRAGVIREFDVYESIGYDGEGRVRFTAYYTPIFEGSLTPSAEYAHPLYKAPPNLVKGPDGECMGLRQADGSLTPCPSRRELETSGMLKGLELVYLKSKLDVYITHVQGSAQIRLPDGQVMEVGYAATNGKSYTSVALALKEEGTIPRPSLGAVRDYFGNHPEDIDAYVFRNERYTFFQQSSGGPYGSIGQPVTAVRSVATDKAIFPRGALVYVAVESVALRSGNMIVGTPFNQFMLNQDTGGAIRAAGRADIYMGIGHQAGQEAGRTYSDGRLYFLLAKEMPVATR